MYGKGLGIANAATGISLLTPQHNRVLFILGAVLLVSGVVIMALSFAISRKAAATE